MWKLLERLAAGVTVFGVERVPEKRSLIVPRWRRRFRR